MRNGCPWAAGGVKRLAVAAGGGWVPVAWSWLVVGPASVFGASGAPDGWFEGPFGPPLRGVGLPAAMLSGESEHGEAGEVDGAGE